MVQTQTGKENFRQTEQNLTQNINPETSSVPESSEKKPELESPSQVEGNFDVEQKQQKEKLPEENYATSTKKEESIYQRLRSKKIKPTTIPQIKDDLTLRIEKIMEEDLKDAYNELTPVQKQEFKIKGEQTAYKIRTLLKGTHIKVKKLFKLLVEWLKFLPGINKYFLEQEAKIKADKILSLKKFH